MNTSEQLEAATRSTCTRTHINYFPDTGRKSPLAHDGGCCWATRCTRTCTRTHFPAPDEKVRSRTTRSQRDTLCPGFGLLGPRASSAAAGHIISPEQQDSDSDCSECLSVKAGSEISSRLTVSPKPAYFVILDWLRPTRRHLRCRHYRECALTWPRTWAQAQAQEEEA